MHERENALKEWLKPIIPAEDFVLKPLAGDASFRRYFRINSSDSSCIAMDAPPPQEDLKPFIHVTQLLQQMNITTPQILAADIEQGFLLLSDLGDTLLLKKLTDTTADVYYHQAIDLILAMQKNEINESLPAFDKAFMLKEMSLCREWFFTQYLGLNLEQHENRILAESLEWIANEVSQQPSVFIHRDYHARNIMIKEENASLAVIDYQDAMNGPLTYDLVSLLKDCYIAWPRERVLNWVSYFYQQSPFARHYYTLDQFIKAFDLCGLQRHLKVLGVFCRLHLRDGKSGYLSDLPLTLNYALECMKNYPDLDALYQLFHKKVFLP